MTESRSDEIQAELYQQGLHTCSCGDSLEAWKGGYVKGTTKLQAADLKDPLALAETARFVFFTTKCTCCHQQVLHGESACDYRETGKSLIREFAKTIAKRMNCTQAYAMKLLRPSMQKYGINYRNLPEGGRVSDASPNPVNAEVPVG